MSEVELKKLEDERHKVKLDQLCRETCEEFYDDSGTLCNKTLSESDHYIWY